MSNDLDRRRLCLVVEDNWLIATGLQSQLQKLGFTNVYCCQTCDEAIAFLAKVDPDYPDLAMLDVALAGSETSLPVARKLVEAGVPFVFATGYGAANDFGVEFPDAETLQKPVFDDQLAVVLDRMLGPNTPG